MNRILPSLALSLVVSSAVAQGLVSFINSPTTLVSAGPVGQEGAISGPEGSYYFGLLIATPGTTDPIQFTFANVYATNIDNPTHLGRFNGGNLVAVPGWSTGGTMSFLVAGWSSSLGHDWSQQWLSGVFASAGNFGLSSIATGTSGCFCGGVPLPALNLFGGADGIQTGWNLELVKSVPEPSITALLALGGATLVIYQASKGKKIASVLMLMPNQCSALDARFASCFHTERHWPGASESRRWASRFYASPVYHS